MNENDVLGLIVFTIVNTIAYIVFIIKNEK